MSRRTIVALRFAAAAISLACLAIPYISAHDRLGLLVLPALILFWIASERWPGFWAASGLLAAYLVCAVLGLTLGAPALLTVCGSLAALVSWDLSDLIANLRHGTDSHGDGSLSIERLRALALVSGASIVLILAATSLSLRLSFGVVVLLSLAVLGCIAYGVRILGDPHARTGPFRR